ncbi:FAD/NAD(P)-binding protein [Roseomonas populi]|uniref:FAD/NAD(P)-binding protein n=1 Tax=Roseomonas populi TaxID=3121582 RepID=A0ABT1X1V0_9PROT|nr:FAD/NAD(P)-binding protein [Roseomonas pecuniae]MCR0982075.1 FAD/NAD(P)-binding protein [Roseomonas pecuniae]
MDSHIDVAILGGGLSGALLAVLLQRALPSGRSIALFESGPPPGRGLAYSTPDPNHILNAPAGAMSLLPDQPDHFTAWLEANGAPAPTGQETLPVARRFAQRMFYGDYVEENLRAATSAEAGARLAIHRDRATALEEVPEGWRITSGGATWTARLCVLAIGHAPSPAVPLALRGAEATANLPADASLLLVGSGLTAVDALMSLHAAGHRGPIRVVSRHGRFPLEHAPPAAAPWVLSPPPKTGRASDLMHWLRAEGARAIEAGIPWQAVLDSVRKEVPALWRGLPLPARRIFMRRALSAWNIHRHRMPAASGAIIRAMQEKGQLTMEAASFGGCEAAPDGRVLALLHPSGEATRAEAADHVILCTGPGPGRAWAADPLLAPLIRQGRARLDPLALGLDTDPDTDAVLDTAGAGSASLTAIGPCAPGARFEITAVPEIRAQAAALVPRLNAALAG